jgi:hypothetical protein
MATTPLLTLVASLAGLLSMTPAISGDDPNTPAVRRLPAGPELPLASADDAGDRPPLVGSWLRLPDMPEPKEQFDMTACRGKIYAVAGINNDDETNTCFVYDTDTGQWSQIASLPRHAQDPILHEVKGRLYSVEGYDHKSGIKYSDVWLYDPNADAWLPRAPIPVPREDAGSAVINGQIWVVGGLTMPGHTMSPRIDIYDPDLDTWLPPLTIKPHDQDWPGRALGDFGCTYGGHFWCLSGTENMEGYPLLHPCPWGFFTDGNDLGIIDLPDPRAYSVLKGIGDCLYVIGGCYTSTRDYAKTMLVFHVPTQTWKEPVPLPYAARCQSACTYKGDLYIAGGYDSHQRSDFFLWMGPDAK